jgi:thymidylate synthase (FAD)
VSRRYVDDEPEFFHPSEWRKKADNKKQGSSNETINLKHWDLAYYDNQPKHISYHKESWEAAFPDEPWGEITDDTEVDGSLDDGLRELYDSALRVYNNMLAVGVAPEQARMVLPQSMYTSYYVTGSLAAWARAYKLRSDPHAQKEIQDLAEQWHQIIGSIPELKYSWEALTNKKD